MTEQLTSFLDWQRRQQERLETEQRRQTLFARTAATRRRGALADRPGFRGLVNVGAARQELTDVRLAARIERLRDVEAKRETQEQPSDLAPPSTRIAGPIAGPVISGAPSIGPGPPPESVSPSTRIAEFDEAIAAAAAGRAEQRRVQTGEEFAVRDRILEIRTGLDDLAVPTLLDPSEITSLEALLADLSTLSTERSGRFAGREDIAQLQADLEARIAVARQRRAAAEEPEFGVRD